ncbi:diaminopimelate epimerase [Streptomyces sp. SID12501]|uniref:Diaminopimelate epimerase n=1 Tax=Streptomyces sp. SID12501 TaxID=2706042 RepID=A0A6B3BUR4_9ACTN|nr:diaminopimelate epimerase [Streptomyces sp. SID12501]NEC88069.1 diaminopimelate epimerase [Streptomyces sp. SID12501]
MNNRHRTLSPQSIPFAKGHGAHNDFIVLPDPAGRLDLTPADIAHLCDRRRGIGADGLLRAVRCTAVPEAASMANEADWFMDYYNADGSQGTMCGNGIRVLARYLTDRGLCPTGTTKIATRAGTRAVHVPPGKSHNDTIAVDMGSPYLPGTPGVTVLAAGRHWQAVHVDMGNPHAVAFLDDLSLAGPLRVPPKAIPHSAYPEGVTVEFALRVSHQHLSLRIHERGVGETYACGTGACAAVAALRHLDRHTDARTYIVDVPGGRLGVTVHQDGTMTLEGPALIVAHGTVGAAGESANGLPSL